MVASAVAGVSPRDIGASTNDAPASRASIRPESLAAAPAARPSWTSAWRASIARAMARSAIASDAPVPENDRTMSIRLRPSAPAAARSGASATSTGAPSWIRCATAWRTVASSALGMASYHTRRAVRTDVSISTRAASSSSAAGRSTTDAR